MENVKWKMKHGKWKMENGRVVAGPWHVRTKLVHPARWRQIGNGIVP